MRKLRSIATMLLASALASAWSGCTGAGGLAGGSKSKESTKNKPEDESGGRPSDDGEGVPGYLTHPENIAVHFENGRFTFEGPAGTVVQAEGDAEIHPVQVVQIPRERITGAAPASVEGASLGQLATGADGSLAGSVESTSDDPLVLSIQGTSEIQLQEIESGRILAVYYDPREPDQAPRALDPALWNAVTAGDIPVDDPDQTNPDGTDDEPADTKPKTKDACVAKGKFWDPIAAACKTDFALVKLTHCHPTPNLPGLIDLIDKKDLDDDLGSQEKLESLSEDGYTITGCYTDPTKATEIQVHLIAAGATPAAQVVALPAASFQADVK